MAHDDQAATAVPSLVDTLESYLEELPAEDRADALHGVFYGFYTRVAIIDRTTYELAAGAREDPSTLEDLPAPLAEALRDNALFVGQELFAGRVRTMRAMGHVAARLRELLHGGEPARPYSLRRAVAFDADAGRLRTYDLSRPGEHPDLPYEAAAYDPEAA